MGLLLRPFLFLCKHKFHKYFHEWHGYLRNPEEIIYQFLFTIKNYSSALLLV